MAPRMAESSGACVPTHPRAWREDVQMHIEGVEGGRETPRQAPAWAMKRGTEASKAAHAGTVQRTPGTERTWTGAGRGKLGGSLFRSSTRVSPGPTPAASKGPEVSTQLL